MQALLQNKKAVIYGAAGAIGSAVAKAFAAEGAHVFLAGRTQSKLDAVVHEIVGTGGVAEAAQVDALDHRAVVRHADAVAAKAGGIDIMLNAIGLAHVQGTPFTELAYDEFAYPITAYMQSLFVTSKAVSRHMVVKGAGVILTISTPGSKMSGTGFLGYGVTCAAVEAFSRLLAGELGSKGIRVVCLRPDAMPEAVAKGSHARSVFQGFATRAGTTVEAMLEASASRTLLGRFPTLAQVADTAVFMASDRAGAITGTVANLTCGSLVD